MTTRYGDQWQIQGVSAVGSAVMNCHFFRICEYNRHKHTLFFALTGSGKTALRIMANKSSPTFFNLRFSIEAILRFLV